MTLSAKTSLMLGDHKEHKAGFCREFVLLFFIFIETFLYCIDVPLLYRDFTLTYRGVAISYRDFNLMHRNLTLVRRDFNIFVELLLYCKEKSV